MSNVVVRMEHCRNVDYCSKGVRQLCARYNIDLLKFLQDGIDADELLRITNNDAMVQSVVENARGLR